jgi:hypothetical protein
MRAGNIRKTFSGEPTAKPLKMLRSCSPLGSAMSFAQSFAFKTLAPRLCKWGAVFV